MLLHIESMILNSLYVFAYNILYLNKIDVNAYNMMSLSVFVKEKRKEVNLTQEQFADRAGVALTVIRKIEQGKENLNLEKVNQVLKMFGCTIAPVRIKDLSVENQNLEA